MNCSEFWKHAFWLFFVVDSIHEIHQRWRSRCAGGSQSSADSLHTHSNVLILAVFVANFESFQKTNIEMIVLVFKVNPQGSTQDRQSQERSVRFWKQDLVYIQKCWICYEAICVWERGTRAWWGSCVVFHHHRPRLCCGTENLADMPEYQAQPGGSMMQTFHSFLPVCGTSTWGLRGPGPVQMSRLLLSPLCRRINETTTDDFQFFFFC